MIYQYKTIPFIGESKYLLDPNLIANQLNKAINTNSSDGWEFYKINNVNIYVEAGCLPAMFGAKSYEKRFDMLVFRKLINSPSNHPLIQDQEKINNAKNVEDGKSGLSDLNIKKKPEAPENPDAKCPNCKSLILLNSTSCWKCKAEFGENSAWKPLPLSSNNSSFYATNISDNNPRPLNEKYTTLYNSSNLADAIKFLEAKGYSVIKVHKNPSIFMADGKDFKVVKDDNWREYHKEELIEFANTLL